MSKKNTAKDITTMVVIDDGESFGGLNVIVQFDEKDLTDELLDLYEGSGEIGGVVGAVIDGDVPGRVLDTTKLIQCYDFLHLLSVGGDLDSLSAQDKAVLTDLMKNTEVKG